ncbi:MAG: bifunctional phosphoribosylaminoimidazolecarboxamide formyltransferase/IMP cyclohydrolase, partial [Actinomycetota bacterium]
MRALLSVFDKTGLIDLGRGLADLGWELVSSGGTARALTEAGIDVTEVAEVTGAAEMLDGRVKTLHPDIHGGILADRSKPEHRADLEGRGIEPIDLVVVNLYPFTDRPGIEMIDIGGPTMVRAAAKNHAHVGIVTDPAHYGDVLEELRTGGALSDASRRELARAAFAHTAAYDAAIVAWFDETGSGDDPLPPTLHLALDRAQDLRYGENPHQVGARYRHAHDDGWWDGAVQHGGKELSFLNLYDTEAAWRLAHTLGDAPAVAVIKHANPCGVAVHEDVTTAYERAHACDPVSAFGGIVAVNRPVPVALAEALAPVFTEVVVAPAYEDGALDVLLQKKNLRVMEAPAPGDQTLDVRSIDGGLLVQTADLLTVDRSAWQVVTE